MSIYNRVNGEIHEAHALSVKVKGEWRKGRQFTKVNGEWIETHSLDIPDKDIVGFKMVYKRCSINKKHSLYPNLQVNYNLPINIKLSGDLSSEMNMNPKGVIFEYFRDDPESEGILMYEGILFAVLSNGIYVNVSSENNSQRVPYYVQGINEYWNCGRLSNSSVELVATMQYENNGYFVAGWNSMFSTEHFMDQSDYNTKVSTKEEKEISPLIMTPITSRDKSFSDLCTIGIARDVHDKYNNMIGIVGYFDHYIYQIKVNVNKKPVVVEIHK